MAEVLDEEEHIEHTTEEPLEGTSSTTGSQTQAAGGSNRSATDAGLWDALADVEADVALEQADKPTQAAAAAAAAPAAHASTGNISFDVLKQSLEEADRLESTNSRAGADALSLQSLKFVGGGNKRLKDVALATKSGGLTSISSAFLKDLDDAEKFTFRSTAKHGKAKGRQQQMSRGGNRRKKKGAMRGAAYADKLSMRQGGPVGGNGRRAQRHRPF
eukprot:INCI668.2.p1 GENE.INCI668.2~~INCI668.2.p1  ORF type:complete len:217 (+),score=47.44 INCI668.2:130-780(+)